MRLVDFDINIALSNPEKIVCRTAECVFRSFQLIEGYKKYPVLAFRGENRVATRYTKDGRLFAGRDSELDLKTLVN